MGVSLDVARLILLGVFDHWLARAACVSFLFWLAFSILVVLSNLARLSILMGVSGSYGSLQFRGCLYLSGSLIGIGCLGTLGSLINWLGCLRAWLCSLVSMAYFHAWLALPRWGSYPRWLASWHGVLSITRFDVLRMVARFVSMVVFLCMARFASLGVLSSLARFNQMVVFDALARFYGGVKSRRMARLNLMDVSACMARLRIMDVLTSAHGATASAAPI